MKFQQRFAAFGLVVGCLFLGPAFAKADTVFNVSGQFSFPGAGTFSGTLTVNTGSGHSGWHQYYVSKGAALQYDLHQLTG